MLSLAKTPVAFSYLGSLGVVTTKRIVAIHSCVTQGDKLNLNLKLNCTAFSQVQILQLCLIATIFFAALDNGSFTSAKSWTNFS
jgi:hypothetical protein